MIIPFHVTEMLRRVLERYDPEKTPHKMAPKTDAFSAIRPMRRTSKRTVEAFWARLKPMASDDDQAQIADPDTLTKAETYSANIENFIGTVKLPVGVIGDRKSVV